MGKKKGAKKSKASAADAKDVKNTSSNSDLGSAVSIGVGIWVAALAAFAAVKAPAFFSRNGDYGTFNPPVGPPKSSPPANQQTPRNLEAERRIQEAKTFEVFDAEYKCDTKTLLQFLHVKPVPGMHMFCIETASPTKRVLNVFQDATAKQKANVTEADISRFAPSYVAEMEAWTWDTLKMAFNTTLGWSETGKDAGSTDPSDNLGGDHEKQPWAIFSPTGKRLMDASWGGPDASTPAATKKEADRIASQELPKLGIFFLMEGGQWIWPGVRKGFRRTIALDDANDATLETLSLKPLVFSVEGFLTEDECDFIQEAAEPNMKYSAVSLMDKDKGRPSSDFRTSKSAFVTSNNKPWLRTVEDRTASLIRTPRQHQEHAQVLQYGNQEKYDSHLDYFDPNMYRNDPRTMATIKHGRRNRMATVFWYLTTVADGGETVFPRAGGLPHPTDNNVSKGGCDVGLKVKPQRGKVIIFYSMTPDGNMDPYSLHGACPVKEGEKWAANKWVWNEPMTYVE